ncbi:GGDEF domain-containing phosphodiesterase [Algibacillus agarilyticus]|uniref:GGDEF domain-containing phosphodiesterase n=1 Tax=Algibacillus agarilyticus TaxID=2234133 RepID=UPI000DCFAB85|nr:GGDEF domain-containing phosphodiesterase [Algibacillus agarilyticus]
MNIYAKLLDLKTRFIFSLVLFLGLGLSVMVYLSAQRVATTTQNLVDHNIPQYQLVEKFRSNLIDQERLLYEYYATDNGLLYQTDDSGHNFTSQSIKTKALLTQLASELNADKRITQLSYLLSYMDQEALMLHANMASTHTNWDQARSSLSKIADFRNDSEPLLVSLHEDIKQAVQQAYEENNEQLQTTNITVFIYSFSLIIISYFVARLLKSYVLESAKSKRLALFPMANPNPIISLDNTLTITYTNPATHRLMEKVCAEGNLSPTCLLPTSYQQDFSAHLAQGDEHFQIEYAINSTFLLANIHWHGLKGGFDVHIQDITAQKMAQRKLTFQAFHDQTSGLANHHQLLTHLDELVQQGLSFSLGMLEIRHFNQLLAGQGIEASLTLVKTFSEQLNKSILQFEKTDNFQLFHISQHVFGLIILNQTDVNALEQTCKLIEVEIEKPISTECGELKIELDFGFSCYPQHGQHKTDLLKHTRAALDQAIEHEHSTFVIYSDNLGLLLDKRLNLQNELSYALTKQEICLNFQPQYDIQNQKLIGMETLVRWHHNGQWISPAEFIPIAEQSGLIIKLGDWILLQACIFTKTLLEQGYDLVVAVNISPRQFRHPDFIKTVSSTINQVNIPAKNLELEITEGVILGNEHDTIEVLDQLRSLGVQLSIDDFGTGYSSLSYLTHFPIDKLKIDQAFIKELELNPKDQSIVQTIIDLGRNLNLTLIAEGVEKQKHWDLLHQMGCHEIQGYFYSKPLTADAFINFLQTTNKSN